jgi:hypothetical protein
MMVMVLSKDLPEGQKTTDELNMQGWEAVLQTRGSTTTS